MVTTAQASLEARAFSPYLYVRDLSLLSRSPCSHINTASGPARAGDAARTTGATTVYTARAALILSTRVPPDTLHHSIAATFQHMPRRRFSICGAPAFCCAPRASAVAYSLNACAEPRCADCWLRTWKDTRGYCAAYALRRALVAAPVCHTTCL